MAIANETSVVLTTLHFLCKAVFPLAKVSAIMLATRDRQSLLTCLGHLGQHNINRNDPISVKPPKVAKASTTA